MDKLSNGENVLEICETFMERVAQKQDKNIDIPGCFILPCIFGDNTNYFSDNLSNILKSKYGNINCSFIKKISEGEAVEAFSSTFKEEIESIRRGMALGQYPSTDIVYLPVIVMLSSKLVENIDEYIDSLIEITRDSYTAKIDFYFIVDAYKQEIKENKQCVVEKTRKYITDRNINFGNTYFLGESTFIFSEQKLDVSIETIAKNIYYKSFNRNRYNWQPVIEELENRKSEYSGKALEELDCNWVSLSYIKFDLCKYLILHYLKEFIENQIGKNKDDVFNIEPTENERKSVEKEIDKYLAAKYCKDNLIKNVTNIPIHVSKIEQIKPKKKSGLSGLFKRDKGGSTNASFSIDNLENNLLNDREYLNKYIEINARDDMGAFDLKSRISSFNLVNKLDKILEQLKVTVSNELSNLNRELELEKSFLPRTENLSLYMAECRRKYFERKINIYFANKKLNIIESEINKNKDNKFVELNDCKEQKENTLVTINLLMNKLTFNNMNFKKIVDDIIEDKATEKVFVDMPWNVNFEQAINSIGQDKFVDLLSDILGAIYKENIGKISKEFQNTMDSDMRNKYCIKYISGFSAGEAGYKPDPVANVNTLYCDYFDAIMSGTTSEIKFE